VHYTVRPISHWLKIRKHFDFVRDVNCLAGGSGFNMRALYEYTGPDDNHLSLTEGEIITAVCYVDPYFGRGQNCDGTTGLFPLNYCQVILAI